MATAWLGLFAHTFQVPLQVGNAIALFLTAWLIYLADRFADASSLNPNLPRSLRQDFCLRHREVWIAAVSLVAGFDAYVIWRTTAFQTFLAGAVVGGLAVVYLVVNHPLGRIWRSLPAKELAIGILFAAGTMVALMPHPSATLAFAMAVVMFAALCALNCISIASWERELDRAQRKVSIATRHPDVASVVGKACLALAFAAVALAIAFREAWPVFACITVSALLLIWLDASSNIKERRFTNRRGRFVNRPSLGADQRTALADLVLLTPVIAIILAAL